MLKKHFVVLSTYKLVGNLYLFMLFIRVFRDPKCWKRMTCNKLWIRFADSQVSQVLLHSHTNIPLHDYTDHACKDDIFGFKLFHNIPWCFSVIYYSIYNIGQVNAPKAAVLRALGDVLVSLRWTDSPELFTLTQTLGLQLVLWEEETCGWVP